MPGEEAVKTASKFNDACKIFVIHSIIGIAHAAEQCNLYILQSEMHCTNKQTLRYDNFSQDNNFLKEIPIPEKTEFAYTGPYQIGDYLNFQPQDKITLKTRLGSELNINFSASKPLIYVIEEKLCQIDIIIKSLNSLSECCTVIFKPYHACNRSELKKFNSSIIVYDPPESDPNLLRFAADFVLAGFRGGSCFSSIMLGLTVLPYYSCYQQSKVTNEEMQLEKFENFIGLFTKYSHPLYYKFFKNWPHFFDLDNIEKIK